MLGVYTWLVAALFFIMFEMGHPGLFFWLSFAVGSCVAALFTRYDFSWYSVVLSFLASSFAVIVLFKLTIGKYLAAHAPHAKTNVDALVGKVGLVVIPITADKPGTVRIGGELWTARSPQKETIKEGARVTVVMVRGAHVVVTAVID